METEVLSLWDLLRVPQVVSGKWRMQIPVLYKPIVVKCIKSEPVGTMRCVNGLELHRESCHMIITNKRVNIFRYEQSNNNVNYKSQWDLSESIFLKCINSNFSKVYPSKVYPKQGVAVRVESVQGKAEVAWREGDNAWHKCQDIVGAAIFIWIISR